MAMRLVDWAPGGAHVFSRAALDTHGEVADEALVAAGAARLVALGGRSRRPDAWLLLGQPRRYAAGRLLRGPLRTSPRIRSRGDDLQGEP